MSLLSSRLPKAAGLAVAAMVLAASAAVSAETTTRPMPWDDCLAAKAQMQTNLAVKSDRVIDIVNSAALTVTRLCTSEGAVSISCSRDDQTLIISVRPQQSELSCLWRSLVKTPT